MVVTCNLQEQESVIPDLWVKVALRKPHRYLSLRPQLSVGSRGSQASLVPFLILKCSGFSPRPKTFPHQHMHPCMMQSGFSCAAIHIHIYACIYIYIHPDTSELHLWDIPYLTSSNVPSHTITKNIFKLFRTAAEGKANAKDKERKRKQSGCVWCQDCWQETEFSLSHMLVLLLLVLLHDRRTLQESQLDRYSMSVAGNSRKQSHHSQHFVYFRIAFRTRKYSQFKNKENRKRENRKYWVLTQSSFTSLGSIHYSSSAC